MAYNEFTLDKLKKQFPLEFAEKSDLFAAVKPVVVSHLLEETLLENTPLALAISTEKARSELLIMPVLLEVRRQLLHKVSLFSGIEFNVAPEKNLKGVCDFLFSRSPEQLTLEAPVVAIVEAKNENIKAGIGQCIAEMLAAQMFNQSREQVTGRIYGVVTTGSNWRFLRLSGNLVEIDLSEYYIQNVGQIVGILVAALAEEA
jgi:hypothetical protein